MNIIIITISINIVFLAYYLKMLRKKGLKTKI